MRHYFFFGVLFSFALLFSGCNNKPADDNNAFAPDSPSVNKTNADSITASVPATGDNTSKQEETTESEAGEEITCAFLEGNWNAKKNKGLMEKWSFDCVDASKLFPSVVLKPAGMSYTLSKLSHIQGTIMSNSLSFEFLQEGDKYNLTVKKNGNGLTATLKAGSKPGETFVLTKE